MEVELSLAHSLEKGLSALELVLTLTSAATAMTKTPLVILALTAAMVNQRRPCCSFNAQDACIAFRSFSFSDHV